MGCAVLDHADGGVRVPATLDDLGALVPGGTPAHVGCPPRDEVVVTTDFDRLVFGSEPALMFPRDPQSTKYVPGDVWLFDGYQFLDELVPHSSSAKGGIKELLEAADKEVASKALQLLGFLPMAWTVPPRGAPMPGQSPAHVRITFSGIFGTATAPVEQWSFSVKTTQPPAQDGPALTAAAKACGDAFTANLLDLFHNRTILTLVTYARVKADGHWEQFGDGAWAAGKDLRQQMGTSTGGRLYPPQVALAVSLQSSRPGPTGRGRFFLPAVDGDLSGDYLIPADRAGQIATKCGAFLKAINAIGAPVSVLSTKGYASTVTGVRVGRVLDTQRSRRNKMREGYVGVTVPA